MSAGIRLITLHWDMTQMCKRHLVHVQKETHNRDLQKRATFDIVDESERGQRTAHSNSLQHTLQHTATDICGT